ncbi:phospholipase D-like domain-containing protein [Acinetobacter sp.]|uniref:phospholipase D-like domain-containing protein n=1 Tax=Acinetobacter sp. TaxID=472 RepID=UPI002FD8E801
MTLSELSLVEISNLITTQTWDFNLTGRKIVSLFNGLGCNDDYDELVQSKEFTKRAYTLKNLKDINGTIKLTKFMESLVDGRLFKEKEDKALLLNEIIGYDQYFFEKNADNIFKIIGKEVPEDLIVKPIFEEIEKEIVKQISSAKYTLWIAVAWITSLPIGREIVKKHRQGINVRIVVNDDDISRKSKVDFGKTDIEYYKISPNNDNYKNLMHHKFCVIDFQKVISGSFNWTTRATYNDENITIIENREQAEAFSNEFIKLIKHFPRR